MGRGKRKGPDGVQRGECADKGDRRRRRRGKRRNPYGRVIKQKEKKGEWAERVGGKRGRDKSKAVFGVSTGKYCEILSIFFIL